MGHTKIGVAKIIFFCVIFSFCLWSCKSYLIVKEGDDVSLDMYHNEEEIIITLTAMKDVYYLAPSKNYNSNSYYLIKNNGVLYQSNDTSFYKRQKKGRLVFDAHENYSNQSEPYFLYLQHLHQGGLDTIYTINLDSINSETIYDLRKAKELTIELSQEYFLASRYQLKSKKKYIAIKKFRFISYAE